MSNSSWVIFTPLFQYGWPPWCWGIFALLLPRAHQYLLLDNLITGKDGLPSSPFFFLRLPIGQYGPVSQLSRSEERCTGPFNWGEPHCAGEKVKRKIGPFLRKSLKNQTRTRTQQKGAQPATATRNPLARLPGARAKEEKTTTNKRLHQQILVRLNVLDLQWTIL